jgi:hypothetical protein
MARRDRACSPSTLVGTVSRCGSRLSWACRIIALQISAFRNNTAAFVHELPADSLSNVAGDSNYLRVQVLTPAGVLDRAKQLGVVEELTSIVAAAAADPTLSERTWVLLTESPEGGWESPVTPTPGPTSLRRPGPSSPLSSRPEQEGTPS